MKRQGVQQTQQTRCSREENKANWLLFNDGHNLQLARHAGSADSWAANYVGLNMHWIFASNVLATVEFSCRAVQLGAPERHLTRALLQQTVQYQPIHRHHKSQSNCSPKGK